MSLEEFLRKSWLYHCQGEGRFPRDMLLLRNVKGEKVVRNTVKDFDTMCNLVLSKNKDGDYLVYGQRSVYVQVYSHSQQNAGYIDRLFMDFDLDKCRDQKLQKSMINMSYRDKLDIIRKEVCRVNEFIPSTVYFTGTNGFAVYPYFPPVMLKHPKEVIRSYIEDLDSGLNLNFLDYSVVGDIARVSRLPYTINMKTQKMCFPISLDWDMDYILEQSKETTERLPVINSKPLDFIKDSLLTIDKTIPDIEMEKAYGEGYYIDNEHSQGFMAEIEEFLVHAKMYYEDMGESGFTDTDKRWNGRHRLVYLYLIPRAIFSALEDEEIYDIGKRFITDTGKEWKEYKRHFEASLFRARKRVEENKPMKFKLESILMDNPDLQVFFENPKFGLKTAHEQIELKKKNE